MANFEVELPDGRKFTVEGAASAQAAAEGIQQMLAQQSGQQGGQQGGQQQPAAAQPEQPERYVDPNASRGMYAVDRTQELVGNAIEGTGNFIKQAVPTVGGPMAEYGRSVAEENAADIARRGYQSTYKGNVSDQSLDTILPFVAEKMIEHSIPTLTTYGGYGAAAVAGALGSVPLATFFATGATIGTLLYGIGETTDELKSKVSKDDYNANAAVIGGTLVAMLDRVGATKALGINKSKLMSMSLTEVTDALKKAGKGNILKKIARGMAIEGVTEAAQENVIMGTAATQGAEYTFDEILDRNLDSAVIGAAMGGGMTSVSEGVAKTARATKQLFSDSGAMEAPENLPDMTQRAAGDFARRLETISGEGDLFERKFNLQDLDKMSQTGARAAIDAAHKDLVGQITKSQNELKSELKSDYEKDTLEVLLEKVKAQVGLSMAKNKTKSVVTFGNFKALQDLVGGYTEGQTLMNLIREAQIMTDVHNSGYQGDLSKFTDMFRVFGSEIGYDKSAVAVERVVRPIASFAAGSQFYFLPTIAQQAVASIGTRLDKARGTYSKVDKFVQENKQSVGQPAPRPPSVREQRLQQAQQASSTRAGLQAYNDKRDGGDNINSPVGKILAGTGLSPDGLNKLLDYIETAPDITPDVMEYVDQTRRNLAGEGNNIDDISPWIQAINGTLNQNEKLDALREDQPDNPLAQRARRRAGFGPSASQSSAGTAQQQQQQTQGRSPAVQSGIDSNRALLERLRQGLAANTSLTPAERGRLETAFDQLGDNLGSDPAVAALDVVSKLKSDGISESLINRHIMPYVERVLRQQGITGTDLAFDQDFAPVPQNNPKMQKIFGVDEPAAGGNYINVATKEDATGQTYSSGSISVTNNKRKLTTSDDQSAPADKAFGNKVKINLFKQKAGWKWVDVENGPKTIVSTETRKDGKAKHFYSLKTDSQSPVTLQTYPNQRSEPRLRPTTHGDVNLGKQIGSISVRGKIHPVYDTITVAPRNNDLAFDEDFDASKPALAAETNPFNLSQNDLDATNVRIAATEAESAEMRADTFKPKKKRTLVDAAQYLQDRWEKATGRTTPFENTPENIDRLAAMMATEAYMALQKPNNAIGWYDRKIKAAKAIMSLIDPRITATAQNEHAFDFALAVTSNGVAVEMNFKYAHEVFNHYMNTGEMPASTFNKGGERNQAMVDAFEFFNAYQNSGRNYPLETFLSDEFTVRDLNEFVSEFNTQYGTSISVPSSEAIDAVVYGSFIFGPKIGQGFYQNIRGNYDPLTMDIWWMRMWNRFVGRPFETTKDEGLMTERRQDIHTMMVEASKAKGSTLEKRIIAKSLKDLGETKRGLRGDKVRFDRVIERMHRNYQSYFAAHKKKHGVNHKKPKNYIFTKAKTYYENTVPQLQAMPASGERPYMRQVTKAAIAKLREKGIDISTADMQALMWYPEKLLFRKLGVQKGQGSDNDYQDAAEILAKSKGITDAEIQRVLQAPRSDANRRDAFDSEPDTQGAYGRGNRQADRYGNSQQGQESFDQDLAQQGNTGVLATPPAQPPQQQSPFNMKSLVNKMLGRQPPTPEQVKAQLPEVRALFEIGKKGSKYEKGIQNLDDALVLADALGLTVRMFDVQQDMMDAVGVGNRVRGVFRSSTKEVFGLKAGTPSDTLGTITDLEALTTMLHEIGHGMAAGVGPTEQSTLLQLDNDMNSDATMVLNSALTPENQRSNREYALSGSFEAAMFPHLSIDYTGRGSKIQQEIINLQENIEVYLDKNISETRKVRKILQVKENAVRDGSGLARLEFIRHLQYVRGNREFAVDPLWVYMANPKLARAVMPMTTALIKKHFKDAQSTDIQFFAHPLAVSLAVVAMMLNGRAEEEEEERQQMPAGALSPQAGALSQQQAA